MKAMFRGEGLFLWRRYIYEWIEDDGFDGNVNPVVGFCWSCVRG
jgi:hypothetical protein